MENERLMSEASVMEVLGLKRQELDQMRAQGLRYVRVSRTKRLYFLSDLYEWAKKNTMAQEQV